MSSHELIRNARVGMGMSEQQLAKAVGVSRGAVQQWERAGGTAPNRTNQPRLAEVIGVPIAHLLGGGSSVDTRGLLRYGVPLVAASAVANYANPDNVDPVQRISTVAARVPKKRHTFALRVSGNSMTALIGDCFPDGSIIIVEPELKARCGDYVIAKLARNEILFRQLITERDRWYLKPLNPHYPTKALGVTQVVGVVRQFSKRFC